MKRYLFLSILIFSLSCEQEEVEQLTSDQLLTKMESISDSIEDLISLSCNNADQCKAAAIGSKPCGGPSHYIIYSTSTDEEQLFQLIGDYTQANEQLNELTDAISNCALETPPNLDCVSGNCEVVEE